MAERALERCEKIALASRYAGAIMHEVNNPLEAITNLVYLTKVQKDDPAQVFENMEIVEQQLKTLARVTQQALTFHRPENETKEWDLVDIAESALKLHTDKILRHGTVVERRFSASAVAPMFGTEILQVVSNLLLNALDAVESGRGRIWVCIRKSCSAVHLTVFDNGMGMSNTVQETLFQPYATSKKNGTGIGLWLSNRIAVKHHGTLRFRSSQAKGRSGTVFRLTIPAKAME